MRVKVSECAAMFYDGGKLVWDDYVAQRQFALTPDAERVVRFFAAWRDLDEVRSVDERLEAIAKHLLSEGVLIEEGTVAHANEQRILARWRPWGAAARHYHFGSRTPSGVQFLSVADDVEMSRQKAASTPPPSPFKSYDDKPFVPLSGGRPSDAAWPQRGLLDALYARRSVRDFGPEPVTIGELGAVLEVAAGVVERKDDPVLGTTVFKTSPSAGACHPIEVYAYASRVDGLEAGLYHFAPDRSGLERIGTAPSAAQLEAVTQQPWLTSAPVLLFFTAVVERSQWRYETARAYRDVLIGLGHISQTALLTATAMGLGGVVATAVSDEDLERLLGIDAVAEYGVGVTALGRPART